MKKDDHIDDLCDLARLTVAPKPLPSMRRLIMEMIVWGLVGFISAAFLAFLLLEIIHG